MPLEWVLFDLNGTLLDPRTIDRALGLSGSDAIAEDALADAVKHAMSLTLAGAYRPFREILEAALARALALAGADEEHAPEGVRAAGRLEPYPEAEAALERLARADLRVAVLTKSARASAEENLAAVGLGERFAEVIGSDEVEAFKPDRRIYLHAAERLEAEPAAMCLVSAHGWDLLGATRAGMQTAWVSRTERILLPILPKPSFAGEDLLGVAGAIAAER